MKKVLWCCLALLLVAFLGGAPATVSAADAQKVGDTALRVSVNQAGPAVDVTFGLALSEISTYPVTITAISGATEEELYSGTLEAGVYRVSAPLTKIKSGPLKIVLKTKSINRDEKGNTSFIIYQKWEGSL